MTTDNPNNEHHEHGPGAGHVHPPKDRVASQQHQTPDHDHPHEDEHGHQHATGDEHVHSHEKGRGVLGWLQRLGLFHAHSHSATTDSALEASAKGIWAVKVSLILLAATASFQVVVVLASGSVALLADTIHNFSDALTSIPLWIAFVLARRAASRRYTYGLGKVEDIAGVIIVLLILASAVIAGYESYRKIVDPTPLRNIEWVIAAAIIGFLGNEAVAIFRTRVGKEIGSAALIADGQHARTDGLTSLAVLFGALGVLAGFKLADPLVGALITFAILFIVKDAAVMVWHRLMDAVDPVLMDQLEHAAQVVVASETSVHGIDGVRLRWLGHRLQAELNLLVDQDLPTRESHRLAEEMRHALFHALPQLTSVLVHVDPHSSDGYDHHASTVHHLSGSGTAVKP